MLALFFASPIRTNKYTKQKNRIEGYHEQKYTLICRFFFKEFLDLIESYQHEDCRFLSLKSSLSGVEENSIQQDKIQQDKIQNTQYNIQYTNIQYIYSFCKDHYRYISAATVALSCGSKQRVYLNLASTLLFRWMP